MLAVAALTASATPATATWDLGHMTVAACAYQRLDPAVRSKIDHMTIPNPAYGQWNAGIADDIKRDPAYTQDKITGQDTGYSDKLVHDYWHHVGIPFIADETPVRAPNALTQLRQFTETLSSAADDDVKSYDLVWMLHIIGYLLHTLHAKARFSRELDDDRGGNDKDVVTVLGSGTKLRLHWNALLGSDGTLYNANLAEAALPSPNTTKAGFFDPNLCLTESFSLAQNTVYTPLIGNGAGRYQLDSAYEDQTLILARSQATLLGARRTSAINTALK
ncbi:S1/P1 nuclease (plasmid) [Agrobacterium sp. rho-13.3]|uniref:S1/P1 nuclease n=1 Tax=Agrobacterium sp. rho-13.3 TaxID=3072980 RepID=UPI002A176F5D|nr:S1/P1 nuclease [Agrobacterium sp. rho-13.3]MDX8311949.1 S1/P1 nuclease [Agrobacterium sp. rho-13.3]